MSFSAAWLELREPYDRRARNAAGDRRGGGGARGPAFGDDRRSRLRHRLDVSRADAAHPDPGRTGGLFDNDLSLLARTPQSSPPNVNVATVPIDLSLDLEAALDGPVDLVTTSALLDLVSDEWLRAARGRDRGAAAAGLCGAELRRARRDDAGRFRGQKNHRRGQRASAHRQGLRSGAGTEAARTAVERFERVGYSVLQGQSDWVFGAARPRDPDAMLYRVGLPRPATSDELPLPDVIGWLNAPPRSRRCRSVRRSVSVTSIFSRGRPPRAEPTGRSRTAPRRSSRCTVHRRQQCLVDSRNRRQRKARPAGAEDDRRDHDMQPVEASRCQETRHRIGAAFDQHAAHAPLGKAARIAAGSRSVPVRGRAILSTSLEVDGGACSR